MLSDLMPKHREPEPKTNDAGKLLLEAPGYDDYGTLGPAMLRLTLRQRKFVIALLESAGLPNYTRAAMMAGYQDNSKGGVGMRVNAHRLAHDPKIQAAIQEEAGKRINASVGMAASIVAEIAADPTAAKKDRLRASEMLLNRGGLMAITKHEVGVTHKEDDRSFQLRVMAVAGKLGLDPMKLLGDRAPLALEAPLEGETVDISSEGLEDLL